MTHPCLTLTRSGASPVQMIRRWICCMGGLALTGCVTVKAPDKPIEINLNINIKQEVVVSLKKDAEDFITNNPDLFPQ